MMGNHRPFHRAIARAQGIPWREYRRQLRGLASIPKPSVTYKVVELATRRRGPVVRFLARLAVRILAPIMALLRRLGWRQ